MIDKFVVAIVSVVFLAWLWPVPGTWHGFWSLHTLGDIGVSLIFLFYGLRLSPEKMKAGLRNVRLHLLVQGSTFLLFPLLVLPLYMWNRQGSAPELWVGLFFLASLPSTVSSSVVMVSIAGGNMAGAIFNASLSALMGVFLTPVWMAAVVGTGDAQGGLGHVFLKLAAQVLLPVGLGVALHHRFGSWAEKHKGKLRISDQSVILLIVYTAFCESFAGGYFSTFAWETLLALAGGVTLLFATVFALVVFVARRLGMPREDVIAAVFCGSKKSLVHGTVMAKVLFATQGGLGLLLLPLMLYHALQILYCSILARRMAQGRVV